MRLSNFGWQDYVNMFKAKGVKLPLYYFKENHWFDIKNKIDTHSRVPISDFDHNLDNLQHGVLYMSSWTSIIEQSTSFVISQLGTELNNTEFYDVGCGKGKVLAVWHQLLGDQKVNLVGVDYNESLLNICRNNLKQIGAINTRLICCDVTKNTFEFEHENSVFYMYNPFDEVILQKFLTKLPNRKTFLIYNNPVHHSLIIDSGFNLVKSVEAWHPNACYNIYQSSDCK